jgi:hypothetical protein
MNSLKLKNKQPSEILKFAKTDKDYVSDLC